MFRTTPRAQIGERQRERIETAVAESYNYFERITSLFKNIKRESKKKVGPLRRERVSSFSGHDKEEIACHATGGGSRQDNQLQELIIPISMAKNMDHVCGYKLQRTIGRGMSGKVKCAISPRTGKHVAIKSVRIGDSKDCKMADREIKVLQSIAHRNIVQLYSVHRVAYLSQSGRASDVIHLVLEYAKGGSMYDLMGGPLCETITRTYFHQLVTALDFCHSRGVYHRDIKPDNLLLTEDFQLKVCDFGLSCIKDDRTELLKTECGTRAYMAPEIFQGLPYNGAKSDCWSAGVLLFLLLSGNSPFLIAHKSDWSFSQLEQGNDEVFWETHRQYFGGFTAMSEAILTRILKPDPSQRPSMRIMLDDEWLREPKLGALELKEAVMKIKGGILADRFKKEAKTMQYDVPDHRDILRARRKGFFLLKGEASAAYQQALQYR